MKKWMIERIIKETYIGYGETKEQALDSLSEYSHNGSDAVIVLNETCVLLSAKSKRKDKAV